MKPILHKQALKTYQKYQGNFKTSSSIPLRKEADLAHLYYPGISTVLEKMKMNPEEQRKICRSARTFGVLSTKGVPWYPLITAKAALLSELSGVNAIPLLISYTNLTELPHMVTHIAHNFKAIFCTEMSKKERQILKDLYPKDLSPLFFQQQTEAAAVVSALLKSSKLLKKSPKKLLITIEGGNGYIAELLPLLKLYDMISVTVIDQRGPIYPKRPNMNQEKIELAKLIGAQKDTRTREEILGKTDVYIHSLSQPIKKETTSLLPQKSVIISLKASQIEKRPSQVLVSTLPTLPNHLTDLHIMAGIAAALAEGKKWTEHSLTKAIKALTGVYSSAKPNKILPGLLEKGLAKKIAKSL